MRVAIIHHWFVTQGGGERVAECIASLFPEAPIYTLVAEPAGIPTGLRDRELHTTFLQKLPLASRFHRHALPLYPAATESLDLRGYNLILSSDSGPVKGVRIDPGAIHICYCHSPMRYLYDGYDAYRAQMNGLTRAIFSSIAGRIRSWDTGASERVTHFIANSNYVADRIRRFYGRESTVIYPPIDVHRAQLWSTPGDHYLCAGRLVGYKRTDLLIEACMRLGRTLRIIGSGPELEALKRAAAATPHLITFLGGTSTDTLWHEYARCRALLFAADEDFGMVPLEAQACGRPVIAYGKGGSLETVRGTGPSPTGIFYDEQTVESIMDGILRFEVAQQSGYFRSAAIQQWANTFAVSVFLRSYRDFVLNKVPAAATAMAEYLPQ
ncbi:glycosyltransferase [Granulicella aggregans]|uniref:glycosyltransferase n=1 Tax=Granulicella aggregans TaxID=474949 RepID=UPI0021E08343|nr:glycosyltransferase [Granulicella aggregans]